MRVCACVRASGRPAFLFWSAQLTRHALFFFSNVHSCFSRWGWLRWNGRSKQAAMRGRGRGVFNWWESGQPSCCISQAIQAAQRLRFAVQSKNSLHALGHPAQLLDKNIPVALKSACTLGILRLRLYLCGYVRVRVGARCSPEGASLFHLCNPP